MKAFLLAAGLGTRLKPLTDRLPKCLVDIGEKPLLGHWFDLLRTHGVEHVLVNTHHLAEQVELFVESYKTSSLQISLSHEDELLGSAGTVAANREFVENESRFLVLYADNLTDVDLSALVAAHDRLGADLTMGLFEAVNPEGCGIAELDADNRIVSFEEKPERPKSNLANAGMYVVAPAVFDLIPAKGYSDFGYDVLPKMAGNMSGFRIEGFVRDVGSLERLELARAEWLRRGRG